MGPLAGSETELIDLDHICAPRVDPLELELVFGASGLFGLR